MRKPARSQNAAPRSPGGCRPRSCAATSARCWRGANSRHRWEVERHGKLVAALVPIADLRELERYERDGAESFREFHRVQKENVELRARLGDSVWS